MLIAEGLFILMAAWLLVCVVSHGYPATVEYVALALKRHARSVRAMHARREAVIAKQWVEELER